MTWPRRERRWRLPAILLVVCACTGPRVVPARPPDGKPTIAVYLIAHAKHTGIAIRRADVPAGLWPESRDFKHAEFLEVGWGNRAYYQSRDPGPWMALKAVLSPTPSVLHVAGFRGPPADHFQASEILELALAGEGFERLVRYVHDAHERTDGPAAPLGPGLYGGGRFYPAWESFHLFRTCNVWTARALRAAGLPIRDSITKGGLMHQAREIGKVVSRPQR